MTEEHINKLSTSQERILIKMLDGEANVFERIRAKLLMMMNPAAEVFADSMRRVSEETSRTSGAVGRVDLWDRIETRIDQEEHAALFLGQRNVRGHEQEPRRGVFEILGLRNLSGAVVAASVLGAVFVARDIMQVQPSPGYPALNNSSLGVASSRSLGSPVNFVPDSPSILASLPEPVEVDWMRSGGEVSFVKDQAKKPAMIWVRMSPQNGDSLGHSIGEEPVIIEERVPQAVTVSNR